MDKNSKPKYGEGTWFVVPLREGGRAIGVIARFSIYRDSGVALGYFFPPLGQDIPSINDVVDLAPEQAIDVRLFGDLFLHDGRWSIIGEDPAWIRARWPFPNFIRRERLTNPPRFWRVIYDDDDPTKILLEERMSGDDESLQPDLLSGAGAVELVLTKKLRPAG